MLRHFCQTETPGWRPGRSSLRDVWVEELVQREKKCLPDDFLLTLANAMLKEVWAHVRLLRQMDFNFSVMMVPVWWSSGLTARTNFSLLSSLPGWQMTSPVDLICDWLPEKEQKQRPQHLLKNVYPARDAWSRRTKRKLLRLFVVLTFESCDRDEH